MARRCLPSVLAASVWLAVALSFVARSGAQAQTPSEPAAQASPPNEAVREVRPGIFQLGLVTLDKARREVRFPAVINQREGAIEYVLVGAKGKTHESLFATTVRPSTLHTAMLLLGAKTGGQEPGAALPPTALDNAYLATAPLPRGVPVSISVRWQLPGRQPVERPVSALVTNTQTRSPMTDGSWIYNGSLFEQGRFAADDELSFVAVVTDPIALMNNPRPGHDDDQIWTVATDRVPPLLTPVEIRITKLDPVL